MKKTTQISPTPVKSDWDLRKFFEEMRFDKNHHLGLGDIRLTAAQQDEICELVEKFYGSGHCGCSEINYGYGVAVCFDCKKPVKIEEP